jgi:hypothetical protein
VASSQSDDLDPHKNDVYLWEDSWPGWNRNHVGIRACRRLIATACRHYKVKCPTVTTHHKRSFSFSIPTKDYISLQGWGHEDRGGLNVPTALHEAAHHIAWSLHGDRIQDHGPTWLGIYLDLLIRAKVAPEVALIASLQPFSLTYRKQK